MNSTVRFEVMAFELWHAFREDGKYEALLDGVVSRKVSFQAMGHS